MVHSETAVLFPLHEGPCVNTEIMQYSLSGENMCSEMPKIRFQTNLDSYYLIIYYQTV